MIKQCKVAQRSFCRLQRGFHKNRQGAIQSTGLVKLKNSSKYQVIARRSKTKAFL